MIFNNSAQNHTVQPIIICHFCLADVSSIWSSWCQTMAWVFWLHRSGCKKTSLFRRRNRFKVNITLVNIIFRYFSNWKPLQYLCIVVYPIIGKWTSRLENWWLVVIWEPWEKEQFTQEVIKYHYYWLFLFTNHLFFV